MRVIPLRTASPSPRSPGAKRSVHARLARALLGDASEMPLPAITDLLSGALALAEGHRDKALLPLGTEPAELAMVRRGAKVLVSYYLLRDTPLVLSLDRPVGLAKLLADLGAAALELAAEDADPISRELTLRLAERAQAVELVTSRRPLSPVTRRGGAVDSAPASLPIAFGFEAAIPPGADPRRQASAHSDAHALLFDGGLWMWARGRRITLSRGPIMLPVTRMVAAVRALVEASEEQRAANVRLRAGSFAIGVRLSRRGEEPVQLTIGSDEYGKVTVPALTVRQVVLPILRLASDLLRALVSTDRSQSRNLRVSSLREEVRGLRRRVRRKESAPRARSLVHDDPERLRAASPRPEAAVAPCGPSPRTLRFDTRWESEVEGLDAASTFLCGDRLIVATPRFTVALARDDGAVLWARESSASASFMTGTVLARLASDGELSLTNVIDGDDFAVQQLAPRVGGPPAGILAGGGNLPPVAVLSEGADRLVAVDLRTGDKRWRHQGAATGSWGLRRVGRILLVTGGDGTVSALDVAHGELLWRFAVDGCFRLPPAVAGDVVLAVRGAPGRGQATLHGLDLFSGRELFSRPLETPALGAPLPAGDVAVMAIGGADGASLAAFDPRCGDLRWMVPDPGLGAGGSGLAVDRFLVVNAPSGRVAALGLDDGHLAWERTLAHPVADDVPRRLEPVLRGGALFVPSASVHVLRPHDGTSIGEQVPCELVPDWTRVDERGWIYVAEESGHLAAMAPRPHLSLVQ